MVLVLGEVTRWKVLWESTNSRESNCWVFWPLCYVTLRYC